MRMSIYPTETSLPVFFCMKYFAIWKLSVVHLNCFVSICHALEGDKIPTHMVSVEFRHNFTNYKDTIL